MQQLVVNTLLTVVVLVAVATAGAMILAIYENGDYLEAIAVMLFYHDYLH